MAFATVVVAGLPASRTLAEKAGLPVAGEASDYESARHLLEELGASAIVFGGIPASPIDAAVPTVVCASEGDLGDLVALGPFAVVAEDASGPFVLAAVATAQAFARAVRASRDDAASARESLEARKLVERAKGILMRRLGLSEDEAYRRLQKASQNENRKMRDVADSIVRTETILVDNSREESRNRTAG